MDNISDLYARRNLQKQSRKMGTGEREIDAMYERFRKLRDRDYNYDPNSKYPYKYQVLVNSRIRSSSMKIFFLLTIL